jgi:hypothetical protein
MISDCLLWRNWWNETPRPPSYHGAAKSKEIVESSTYLKATISITATNYIYDVFAN